MMIMADERKLFLFYLDDVITMISNHGDLQGIAMKAKHEFKKLYFLISVLLTEYLCVSNFNADIVQGVPKKPER